MYFHHDPVLDSIAATSAPRLTPSSEDGWFREQKALFESIKKFHLKKIKNGEGYDLWDMSFEEPILSIRTYPKWSITRQEDLCFFNDTVYLILSPQMEKWVSGELEYIDSLPTNRVVYPSTEEEESRLVWLEDFGVVDRSKHPSTHEPVRQLRIFLDLTFKLQGRTSNALFSGYLPRHQLPLAILLERIPALHEYTFSFPTLLTYLAEELIYGDGIAEDFLLEVSGLIKHGWRGLFVACGLNPTLKNVMFSKRVLLGSSSKVRFGTSRDRADSTDYMKIFKDTKDSPSYLVRFPIHETVFLDWEQLRDFFSHQPDWINWQVNQHLRIFQNEKDHEILKTHLDKNYKSSSPSNESYLNLIATSYLPLLKASDLIKSYSTVPLGELTPKRFQHLPNPEQAERQKIFETQLSLEEQLHFRSYCNGNKKEELLKLLDGTQFSEGILRLFHTWNDVKIDEALMQQFALPSDLIEKFITLYPGKIENSPAYLFANLAGNEIEPARRVSAIIAGLKQSPLENSTSDHFLRRTDFMPLRDYIQIFGHTYIGSVFVETPYFKMPCLIAKALWKRPQQPVWEQLLTHPRWEVQACLTLNPYLPGWVRERLARHPLSHVRAFLAEQPWFIIDDVLPVLLRDESDAVIHALAANNSLPEDILIHVPLKSYYVAALLFFNVSRGEKMTQHLVRFGFDGDYYLQNPGFTDSNRKVKKAFGRNICSTTTM